MGTWGLGELLIFSIHNHPATVQCREFDSDAIDRAFAKWSRRVGKVGVAARGISFVLTGIYLIQAAMMGSSELAGGLQNAFQVLASQTYGRLWLGTIGMGFISYGLYMFVATRYRRYAVR